MTKREIRKEFMQKRKLITDVQQSEFDRHILDQFRSISFKDARYVLSYAPIHERKEFDPGPCEQVLRFESNVQVFWPKLFGNDRMEAVLKDEHSALSRNHYNIVEPVSSDTIDPQMLHAVFVPLLAFDLRGFRVGYGKGFYDRFLARCNPDVSKIGFSYYKPVDRIEDADTYDIPLNVCITPERIYEF
jgi:5-formyltetrahydrofolate cyclo-ligase